MKNRIMRQKTRHSGREGWRIALFFLLISCVLGGGSFGQQGPSQNLKAFIDAVNSTYVIPNGWDYKTLAKSNPRLIAVLIGYGLRDQQRYAASGAAQNQLNALLVEVRQQLDVMAEECGNVDARGAVIRGVNLWDIVDAYMLGRTDDFRKQNPTVQLPSMPPALPSVAAQAGQYPTGQDSIKVIGVEAKPAGRDPSTDAPWLKNKPGVPANNPLKEDCILGLWQERPDSGTPTYRFRVTREGNQYVGRVESILNPWEFKKYFSFGVGTELFRVELRIWVASFNEPVIHTPEYEGEGYGVDTTSRGFIRKRVDVGINDTRNLGVPLGDQLYFKSHWFDNRSHFLRVGR
jgi:hypothetical protein